MQTTRKTSLFSKYFFYGVLHKNAAAVFGTFKTLAAPPANAIDKIAHLRLPTETVIAAGVFAPGQTPAVLAYSVRWAFSLFLAFLCRHFVNIVAISGLQA